MLRTEFTHLGSNRGSARDTKYPHMPLLAPSVVLRSYLDCADDAGVQGGEVFGGDPAFEDGLASNLVDLVLIQE